MNKCIQPSCACIGYKEPQSKSSTLLQFRQNCQECGHQASDHRELTAVDKFIKTQILTGKRSRCTSLIMPSEILTSPIFDKYDLIPIPYGEADGLNECGVQCTCTGFQVPDLIRLCQKFRTYSLNDTALTLKSVPCSFCKHPFSCHVTNRDESKDFTFSPKKPSLGMYHGLVMKRSSLVYFSPANQKALELIMPSNPAENFLMMSVGKFQASEMLRLAIVIQNWNSTCADTVGGEDSIEPEEIVRASGLDSSIKKVKRKHFSSQESGKEVRRSMRLATKKSRLEEEQVRKQLRGLKGSKRVLEVDVDDETEEIELTQFECKQLNECSINFVKHLGIRDSYQSFPLPQELLDLNINFPIMTALRITTSGNTDQDGSQDALHPGILVAVTSKNISTVFLSAIPCDLSSDQIGAPLKWHKVECEGKGGIECLALNEASTCDLVSEVLLMVGMSSGSVCIWRVTSDERQIKDSVLVTVFNCSSRLSALSCSPEARILATGTIFGRVVFCFLTSSDGVPLPVGSTRPHLQTLQCCNAPVKCITWSKDQRLVAVGGCDDTIQILQCIEPNTKQNPTKTNSVSLLNYFKRTESSSQPKFIHTCTLKGHASFVTDLRFTHGHCLTSIGWDSQILFWRNLTQRNLLKVSKWGGGKPVSVEVLEPVGGYKLGPSSVLDFIPSSLHFLMGCGLMVSMANKLGGVTVAFYTKNLN